MQSSKLVVILIIAHKSTPTPYEVVSLKQCASVLSNHQIVFICPEGMDASRYLQLCPSAVVDYIAPHWQSSYANFNRLKIHPFIYKKYAAYKYILFYEPDSFVFTDELEYWCNKDYDYIGAPWFEKFETASREAGFLGVGNGGFSLRKISAHLKALHSFSYINPPLKNLTERITNRPKGSSLLKEIGGFSLDLVVRNNTFWPLNSYRGLEDQFWGLVVARNFKWFKTPTYPEAMNFSFEMQPGRLYELNNKKLPFGCHAWWKYEVDFWKPHIEAFGYKL